MQGGLSEVVMKAIYATMIGGPLDGQKRELFGIAFEGRIQLPTPMKPITADTIAIDSDGIVNPEHFYEKLERLLTYTYLWGTRYTTGSDLEYVGVFRGYRNRQGQSVDEQGNPTFEQIINEDRQEGPWKYPGTEEQKP